MTTGISFKILDFLDSIPLKLQFHLKYLMPSSKSKVTALPIVIYTVCAKVYSRGNCMIYGDTMLLVFKISGSAFVTFASLLALCIICRASTVYC